MRHEALKRFGRLGQFLRDVASVPVAAARFDARPEIKSKIDACSAELLRLRGGQNARDLNGRGVIAERGDERAAAHREAPFAWRLPAEQPAHDAVWLTRRRCERAEPRRDR